MDKHVRRWTDRRKVALLRRLVRGDTTMVAACREHDLKRSEVEGWLKTFLRADDGALAKRAADGRHSARAPRPIADERRCDAALTEDFAHREANLQTIIDTIPTLAWCAHADGSAEFFNQRWRDYTGLAVDQARDWGWTVALHPEDTQRVAEQWRTTIASAQPGEVEARLRRWDGEYHWFLFRAAPSLDERGAVLKWYGTNTDIEERKRAEEILRASEQSLRLIIDSIPGFVCTMSAGGDVEFVSRQILDYLGMRFEELNDWQQLALPAEDRARVADAWNRSIETGGPYDIEHRIRRADGVYRWFHVRGLPLRDPHGSIARWYMLLADIEDRKRAEEARQESERELRLLIDSIPGMIAVSGPHGELEYVNRRLLDYGGMELAEVQAIGWPRVLHPDDAEAAFDTWQRCLATGQAMDATFRIRRFDGTYRWFDTRTEPLVNDRGEVVRWYGMLWDIEDRKRAEEALQASQQQFQVLVDSFPGMVGVTGPEGAHEYANRRALDFLGKTASELTSWAEAMHPDDILRVADEWIQCTATGQPLDTTFRMRRFDGVYRWIHSRAEPLLDEEGRVLRWHALMVDVDDQKKAEEGLRASQAELAHITRVTTMGELTASIAHEVNQPLTAVINNASACLGLLPDDAPQCGEVREALNEIVDDAERASGIIARIRQLARKAPLENTRLDVRDMVDNVLTLARHESADRRVTIHTELPAEPALVLGDRVQLQQVLLNLVVNGMDAMRAVEEGKRVLTIRVRCEGKRMPSIVVSVEDAGLGIAREEMDRLFDAFYSTKPRGMGMGLAISRSIITAHDGQLWAEANSGPGATFAFSLPAASVADTDPVLPDS